MKITNEVIKDTRTVKRLSKVPMTVKWKNARLLRMHSLNAVADEMLTVGKTLELLKINIVGNPSTGKTTFAMALAHTLHKKAKKPFSVKVLGKDDLTNFEQTLANLQPMNHILVFDDVSFMKADLSAQRMHKIEQAVTQIRHLPGGQDVQIILIFNFHYSMAMSKYLRQSDYNCYTSIGDSDLGNVLTVVGKVNNKKVQNFRKRTKEAILSQKFSFKLGKKGKKFTYENRKPFALALVYNGVQLRNVVFPKREWIDTLCNTCTGENITETSQESIEQFDKLISTKFGPGVIKQALRVKLIINGIFTERKRVKQAMTFIDKYIDKNPTNLEQLAIYYGLQDKKTRLKIDPAIFEEKSPD